MKCIFCLNDKPGSDEHVIPDSIGGTLCIDAVCRECNSNLSRLVDSPFASCPLIEFARYNHSLGGKRGVVPFPLGGVGTLPSGLKVSINREFKPHVKRELEITEISDEGLAVNFSADPSDKDNFDQMLGKPLRKAIAAKFPDWPAEKIESEIERIVSHARAQTPIADPEPIKKQLVINPDDLLFEFLKIAYEMWFRSFGYSWVENSATAALIRDALMRRDSTLPIHGKLFCRDIQLPTSDPSQNHLIFQSDGVCFIRLFNICCSVGCEETDAQFKLPEDDSRITIQYFHTGRVVEEPLRDFLEKHCR